MTKRRTWRYKHIANWSFCMPERKIFASSKVSLHNPKERKVWVAEQTAKLLLLLKDFAEPGRVRVAVRGVGAEAYRSELKNEAEQKELIRFLREEPSVLEIDIDLNLNCFDVDGEGQVKEFQVIEGAYLALDINLDGETGQLDLSDGAPAWLVFYLYTDIYSPRTSGEIWDNRIWAKLNGPRLTSLLKRITEELPVEFEEVYTPNHGDVVTPYGFMTVEELEQRNPDLVARWEQEKAARGKKSDE